MGKRKKKKKKMIPNSFSRAIPGKSGPTAIVCHFSKLSKIIINLSFTVLFAGEKGKKKREGERGKRSERG